MIVPGSSHFYVGILGRGSMNMAFGRSITDLLETYSNCISLLRAFRHRREDPDSNGAQEKQDRLRKSLRSDRNLVERAYLSRVSETGNRFRKGDGKFT